MIILQDLALIVYMFSSGRKGSKSLKPRCRMRART